MSSTQDIDALIEMMAKLPGLGPRSARRAVLHLIRKRALLLTPLADVMQTVAATARECLNCGNVGTTDICDLCTSEKRANGELCVVEDVADLWAMERSGVFAGRYHVLGGTLSALDAIGPHELETRVTLTSLAQGVPIGGELDYLDDGTITAAMRARKAL
jgi:recombination protein RecR